MDQQGGKVCVFQEWMFRLPMQQQSVLVLALRGPDGIGKHHPCKNLVARYRACVLKQAYSGRATRMDEDAGGGTFMTLACFSDAVHWNGMVKDFFTSMDDLPHHYYMHLMHGAQILGYKHPEPLIKGKWNGFYWDCCSDLHLNPESEQQMDERLGDWGREFWDEAS